VDENTKTVLITAIAAIVTIITAYVAARWNISRRNGGGGASGNP
jgi:hypothetical protein